MVLTAKLHCLFLIHVPSDTVFPSEQQLRDDLEKGDLKTKTEAIKALILMLSNGEKINSIFLMYVIRFCIPVENKIFKRLLLLFWEILPMTDEKGKLLQETILICDAFRKDLQHRNEFVVAATLRFLCKLKEPEFLEPFGPLFKTCLKHSNSYVRKSAALAIFIIHQSFDFLIPDAFEHLCEYFELEDSCCKRNTFFILNQAHQARLHCRSLN